MTKEAKPQNRSAIAGRFMALRREVGLSQSCLGEFVSMCRAVQFSPQGAELETMEPWLKESPTINLNRVTAKGRSRRQDALRRLFSTPSSPEAKADIAARFKALRRKAMLSQADLGNLIGICRQSVSKIENCRVWPHYTTSDRFSDLEVSHEQARRVRLPRFPKHWR